MAITVSGLTVRTQTGGGTWVDYGGGGGSAANTDVFLSSTGSRSRKVSNGIKGFAYEIGAGGVNLTSTVVGVRWATLAGVGALNTRANGGVRLRLEDTSGNQSDWYVDGNDTYTGGWRMSVIDTTRAASANNGTAATLASIRYVGIVWDETASVGGGDANCYVDQVLTWPNTGLTASGNTTSLVGDLQSWDDTGTYGIVETRAGVVFTNARWTLSPDATGIGSTGETLVLESLAYKGPSTVDAALSSLGLVSSSSNPIDLNRLTVAAYSPSEITGTKAAKRVDFATASSVDVDLATVKGFDEATDAVQLGGSGNTYDDVSFEQCGKVSDTGAVIRGCVFRNTTDATGAYEWTSLTDLEDCRFVSDGTGHGIDMQSAPVDPLPTPFVDIVGVGWGANDTADATVDNNTAHDVLIAASGTTSGVTVNPTSSTTYANSVAVTVTVQDAGTLAAVEGARVLMEAAPGGPLPSDDAISITAASVTASVTHTAHGLTSGDQVIIRGAAEDDYNGLFTVVVTGANTYTYTMGGSPSSPATGTPEATAYILSGVTDSSGVVQDAGVPYTSDQPVRGRARRASSAPYYKSTPIIGTVTSAGLDVTVVAVPDE